MKRFEVKLRQVAAKTDVEGRAGALSVELRLGSLHLDVGTGTLVWKNMGFGAWIFGRCDMYSPPPPETNMTGWNITISNQRYIFKMVGFPFSC